MAAEGRAVLVTGASRGIGAAVARVFASAGDRVAVHYRAARGAAEATLASMAGDGHVLVDAHLADAASGVPSSSFRFDDFFSMGLHVVREHHDDFAVVSDIHKANAVERPVQKLYNRPLRDHDRSIPGIPLRYRHGADRARSRMEFRPVGLRRA